MAQPNQPNETQRHHDRQVFIGAAWSVAIWPLCFGLYVLFEGQVSLHECITGASLAALATLYAYFIARSARFRFEASAEAAFVTVRALAKLGSGLSRSFAPLLGLTRLGASPGRGLTVPFKTGAIDDPAARTRRAIAVLAASLAPDRFVVRLEVLEGQVILHDITGNRQSDSEWLI